MSHTHHTSILISKQPAQKRPVYRDYRSSNCDLRERQLADIAASGDDDNSECAAADLFREFPPTP